MSNHTGVVTEWSAQAVQQAIEDSGMTKLAVSEASGIPYATLNRKLAAKADFGFRDLMTLAETLGVHPSAFIPPMFASPDPQSNPQLEKVPA
ncbi:MAG: helix-turn-helix domain-containing protein [Arthrobacter sp.]|jgi:lambda repressor-like predicted transcriptional regulator|nr:helix-turn-helix domain-containing protein [Arthrobacter sp.]